MVIVQIGTNQGDDEVTSLVKANAGQVAVLLLVEPLALHNEAIRRCYNDFPQAVIENACITDDPEMTETPFYYYGADNRTYEVASMNPQHPLKHSVLGAELTANGLTCATVPAMTAGQLFDKHGLKSIDVLWIDAEGMDDRIIYGIDLGKYDIAKIVYEHLHIEAEPLITYLESKGYKTHRNIGLNGWSNSATK